MDFPERVYTTEEVNIALELVTKGYQHRLRIEGSSVFKVKVRQALKHVKTAGYHDFLRTYVRSIVEIEGFDVCPCAGTHVKSTEELGRLEILKKENKGKDRERIVYTLREI